MKNIIVAKFAFVLAVTAAQASGQGVAPMQIDEPAPMAIVAAHVQAPLVRDVVMQPAPALPQQRAQVVYVAYVNPLALSVNTFFSAGSDIVRKLLGQS